MSKCTSGVVTWFNENKGYGFIRETGDATKRDIFVHYTAITGEGFKTLAEGQEVVFDLVEPILWKSIQALNVQKVAS